MVFLDDEREGLIQALDGVAWWSWCSWKMLGITILRLSTCTGVNEFLQSSPKSLCWTGRGQNNRNYL